MTSLVVTVGPWSTGIPRADQLPLERTNTTMTTTTRMRAGTASTGRTARFSVFFCSGETSTRRG